jgi:UDP-GlcNAc:undecaprenyl-phosphate GlcNAc-1-phosphate transferase
MNNFSIDLLHGLVELLVAAAATYTLLRLLEPLAIRFGLLDHPHGRKDHAASTPSIGGIAMFAGMLVAAVAMHDWTPHNRYFMAGAAILVVIGVLDDLRDIRWWIRIVAQCVAVWVMTLGGTTAQDIGRIVGMRSTGLGVLSMPFTIFVTVGLINAINMIDGVDGLAGSIMLASMCMLGSAAIYSGNFALFIWTAIFAGAIIGFLLMNMRFPWQARARVFMGNAGSALLGFAVAWTSIRLTQNPGHPVTPVLGPWLIATPVIDCLALIAHRLAHGRSPFYADRDHMHHLMLDAGFRPAQLVLTLVAINFLLGLMAAIGLLANVPLLGLVLVYVGICIGYFWLTLKRERAVAMFAVLGRFLNRLGLKHAGDAAEPLPAEKN